MPEPLTLASVRHRVVNDLSLVHALLGMAMRKTTDADAVRLLKGSRNRVRVIALFHSVAWRGESDGADTLDTNGYLGEVVREAERARGVREGVQIELEAKAPALDLAQIGALGLVVNELVGNALDHAFPGDRHGRVRVNLGPSGSNEQGILLRVADDGVGLPAVSAAAASPGLGLWLVRLLAEQLSGELVLSSSENHGTDACLHLSSTRETHAWQPS